MRKQNLLSLGLIAALGACTPKPAPQAEGPETSSPLRTFKGKVAEKYEESQEWWPELPKAPGGAANVIIFLLDDTGFGQLGCYGGLIETPSIDQLAAEGLRFNNFHTTALCSPSRASIMAGRNPHNIGLGSHSLTAMGFPGYNALIPEDSKSVAKIFQHNGYTTYAIGKWDHTPLYEVSQIGPFERWPSGEGYDHFYGFMAADADNFRSVLWEDHAPVEPWLDKKDYHLSEDMADRAITYITGHKSIAPERPFFMFWAPVAMHSPHQAPKEFIDKYKGEFDMGWDKAREMILARQKEMGVIPENTQLTERPKDIPAWNSLKPEEKKLYARQMEAFAGMLDHVDREIGRIVKMLKRVGEYDNTFIIVTSDNGASGEGGLTGSFNETYILNGLQTPFDANMSHLEGWGGRNTYPHYHAGWTMAGNTPFKYFKQIVHRGGIQDPFIVHWPKGIQAKGEVRQQYHHIVDVAPTLLDVAGLGFMEYIDGIKQTPYDGVSMRYCFDDKAAADQRTEQFYELFGNRALYKDGWKAVTIHGNRMPWDLNVTYPFEKDVWELYNLNEDFSESRDLADQHPEKLKEMISRWKELARENHAFPLYDDMIMRLAKQQDRLFGDKKEFIYYYPGAIRIAEKASPPVKDRAHTIKTTINLKGNEEGVIVACGGFTGGYTLFIKDHKLYYDYNFYNGVYYTGQSPRLPRGETELMFKFIKTGPYKGTGELYVNGKKVDTIEMPEMHISTFSLSETFDVGGDYGTPVSVKYPDHFLFKGDLDKVIVTIDE